ncbi:MAG: aminoacyl-histidine dipeptidase [Crocinitomicaceae bacterium]|nr:aminoacyl-histidine dipeptidase [Crocinitomicaceae bacterium]
MYMSVRNLEPKVLWNHFAAINAVPRPSKREEKIVQYMIDFGHSLGLETTTDAIQNVIIKKPATPGMEDRKTVILQSHLDMVHQKNADTVFDFETQGIDMYVDGDWVKARGTTLGADNGIGVASIMSILSSKDIPHPAIEALFTIDEETGMTGALKLDGSHFKGEILLNLDSEDDDELAIGCAGGIDTNTKYYYQEESVKPDSVFLTISIRGLLGGHSGMDIDKGRGNSNKLMNRILYHLISLHEFQLITIDGGSLRNAIPRESTTVIAINKSILADVKEAIGTIVATLLHEFKSIEKDLTITVEEKGEGEKAVVHEDILKILNVIYAMPNGVFRMSPDIEGLVETSSSLARVIVNDGTFITQSLQRSSVESTKTDIANAIRSGFELANMSVVQNGDYPGWQPNPNSPILKIMHKMYVERFKEEPHVRACHAGLECGILGIHLPGVDMISFGPNIRAPHSPDERVQISSVQKFWGFLLEVLKQTPVRG